MKKLFGRKSEAYNEELEMEDLEYDEYSDEYSDEEYEEEYFEEAEYVEDGEYVEEAYEDQEYYAGEDGQAVYYEDEIYYEEELEFDDQDVVYLEDDEEDEDSHGFWYGLTHMGLMDRVIMFTGVMVLALALIVGGVYFSARIWNEQVSSFDSVGNQLTGITMIGESGLMAVADAEEARINAANNAGKEDDKEYNENDYDKQVTVAMNTTSVQKDLKVKFVNERTNKLIGNVPFAVEVTNPSGKKEIWTDDDMDGIVYKKEIAAGKYVVALQSLEDKKYEKYVISGSGKNVTVKDKIVYEKVEVEDEIKDESEINAKEEDTAKKDVVVESTLKDTVVWVESTKNTDYMAVPKSSIKDPAVTASVGTTFLRLSGFTISGDAQGTDTVTLTPARPTGTYTGYRLEEKWTSGSDQLATVAMNESTKAGVVTAKGAGAVAITYSYTWVQEEGVSAGDVVPTTMQGQQTWNLTIQSAVPTPSVTLDKNTLSLEVGKTYKLIATVVPEGSAITWTTDDKDIATVAADGTVTAVGQGTTRISASTDQAAVATCTITVTAPATPITAITLSKNTLAIDLSSEVKTAELTATVTGTGEFSKEVSWKSSDETIAKVTVDEPGKATVTGLKAGTATITVTSKADETKKASCTVTVTGKSDTPISEVTLSEEELTIDMLTGEVTAELTATVTGTGEFSKEVTWKSSDEKIVKVAVDETGKATLTAVKAGEATITVTSKADETKFATCAVKVTGEAVTALVLEETEVEVPLLTKLELKAKTTPEGGKIVWTSDKKEIATVDEKGVVTGVKEGTAVITATCGSLTAKCTVKVTKLMTLDKITLTVIVGGEGTVKVTVADDGKGKVTAASADTSAVTVSVKDKVVTYKGISAKNSVGTTIAYTTTTGEIVYQDVMVSVVSNTDKLKNDKGQVLYVKNAEGKYVEAAASDYYKYDTFYLPYTKYTGWQTINGKVYFYNVDGKAVTGTQVIQGAEYTFAADGSLMTGSGVMGIDVSKWNGTIDWKAVKNSGVSYVIIRCGYRGSSNGSLIIDPKFHANIKGATSAGLKVGVYFFTQALDEIEAVEEASMVLSLIKDYKISYPVFLDVESSGGRADKIDSITRTKVIKAFCETIEKEGYTAGVYANKTWLEKKMDAVQLEKYVIWLAQYAAEPTYTKTRYDIWQYKDTGKVSGISGNVDLNLSYWE